jgi:hypothetical protein
MALYKEILNFSEVKNLTDIRLDDYNFSIVQNIGIAYKTLTCSRVAPITVKYYKGPTSYYAVLMFHKPTYDVFEDVYGSVLNREYKNATLQDVMGMLYIHLTVGDEEHNFEYGEVYRTETLEIGPNIEDLSFFREVPLNKYNTRARLYRTIRKYKYEPAPKNSAS